jgi:hypothetical protein
MMLFDRSLDKAGINVNLPDLLEQERPMALVLMIRAYHALNRTMGSFHVSEIIPPDIIRDTKDVIAGSDIVSGFLASDLVVFDKLGPKSRKRIPIEVLANEFTSYKAGREGKRGPKKMSKKDFSTILEVTGAVPLIMKNADVDKGPARTFGVPQYPHK